MNETNEADGNGTTGCRKLRTLGLFSGCGGLDLGFEQSGGFEIAAANEFWKPAAESYRLNRPTTSIVEGDITSDETKRRICSHFDKESCEAIIGGFSCQSFSVAGNRDERDPRGTLYEDYVELVRRLHPILVVMENVPGLLTMARPDGTPVADWIARAFRRLGYAVGYRLLNSADFGVPQARKRVFIIAWRRGSIPSIRATHDENGRNGLPPWRTFRDAVSGLSDAPKDFVNFPEKRLRFLKMLKAGQDWRDLPPSLQAEAMGKLIEWGGGSTGCFRRLSWDRPSPTLTCNPIQKMTTLCHPSEDRPLSVQEYRRLQEFPDGYRLAGSTADQYAQLGNAVPVGLARAVAVAVRGMLPDDPGNGEWRHGGIQRDREGDGRKDDVGGKNKHTVGSLFAGIGGICLGFRNAGCEVLWANEFDENACRTYRHNFKHKLVEADIHSITNPLEELGYVDIIISGFPCQAFSIAGKQKGFKDPRGSLFFETARFIDDIKPKAFILENVRNLRNHDKGNTFKVIKKFLTEKLGYSFIPFVLNSKDYGNIPQTRNRIYIVGFRGESGYAHSNKDKLFVSEDERKTVCTYNFEIPHKMPLTKTIRDMLENGKQPDKYYYQPGWAHYEQLKQAMLDRDAVYQFRRTYVRENKSNVCPTLTANMGTGGNNVPLVIDDFGLRKLTPHECVRFQGFPEGFSFPEGMADCHRYKQAGNSVVVPVVERIARAMVAALDNCAAGKPSSAICNE